jgi:lysophospholipase L1-like esterase
MTTLRICFVGDSITNGTLDGDFLGWPGRLCMAEQAAGHDLTLYNLGVRADTSADIAARWLEECRLRLPDHVHGALVFAFGVNDAAEQEGAGLRVPLAESVENARSILTEAKAMKPTLWIGPSPVDESRQPIRPGPGVAYHFDNERTAALNRAYADLADRLAIPYLDLYKPLAASGVWKESLAAGDGVHPSAPGYALIADRVRAWEAWREWFSI